MVLCCQSTFHAFLRVLISCRTHLQKYVFTCFQHRISGRGHFERVGFALRWLNESNFSHLTRCCHNLRLHNCSWFRFYVLFLIICKEVSDLIGLISCIECSKSAEQGQWRIRSNGNCKGHKITRSLSDEAFRWMRLLQQHGVDVMVDELCDFFRLVRNPTLHFSILKPCSTQHFSYLAQRCFSFASSKVR